MKRIPDLHVYGRGATTTRIVLRNEAGDELDLTPWKVTEVSRTVKMDELPVCTVTFIARLIEHQETP